MMYKDIFVFHPENRDFLAGNCAIPGSLWNTTRVACTGIVFFVLVALFYFGANWRQEGGNQNALVGGFFFMALAGLCAALALRSYYRAKLRRDHGRVVPGQIISCTGGSDADGTFGIEIHYAFVNPEGKLVERKEAADREDLRGAPLPETGTSVVIFYASDYNCELL